MPMLDNRHTSSSHAATQLTRVSTPPAIDDSAESAVAAQALTVAVTPDAAACRSDDSAESPKVPAAQNTDVPPTTDMPQNPFGATLCFQPATKKTDAILDLKRKGCDPAGFPNGRRPGDDVVDIELRVVMGYLLNTTVAPSGQLPFVDGAGLNAFAFDFVFPYLTSPKPGAPQMPPPGDLSVSHR